MTKYEINCITDTYLLLWSHDVEKDYITLNQIRNHFNYLKEDVFAQFFNSSTFLLYSILDEIYYDSFFQFVCIFIFLSPKQIITLLLSHQQIYSNIFITETQIHQILKLFNRCISSEILEEFYKTYEMDLSKY